jgi:hypothetical protein
MLKLFYPQAEVSTEILSERLKLAKLYVDLTRVMMDRVFPDQKHAPDLELLLVLVCVFIGDAEGRVTTPTKLSSHSGLPRTNVYRRLKQLEKMQRIVKVGKTYHVAKDTIKPDRQGLLRKILLNFIDD